MYGVKKKERGGRIRISMLSSDIGMKVERGLSIRLIVRKYFDEVRCSEGKTYKVRYQDQENKKRNETRPDQPHLSTHVSSQSHIGRYYPQR